LFYLDTISDLERIFHPKSVTIVGASSREGSFGRLFLSGFLNMGFKEIFPVHPREKELLGLKAYASVKEIPCEVDMAILLIPYGEVFRVVQECADKGVKGIVLFTAGFSEKSPEGKRAEAELAAIARQGGSRIIGPNTNGLYSPEARLLALPGSLTAGGLTTEKGIVSVFAQSGSFNDYLCQVLIGKNIRFNKVVSCGNECDLSIVDYLEYYGQDPGTHIIAGYMEGVKKGRQFFEQARVISRQKPIIIWKGGVTETGARAAMAHTGSLAGARQVWDAMFKQAGIIKVSSFEEICDCIMAFNWLAIPQGRRVAILSGMGGTNVGTADNCILLGLEMARFTDKTRDRLAQLIPSVGTAAANPIDIGVGSLLASQLYGETVRVMAEDDNVDMVIAISSPENPVSIASIAEAARDIKKPLAVALFEIPGLVEAQFQMLLEKRIPAFSEPKRAAFALAKMADYADYLRKNNA
jgi:acetate---CoA ligase (ADP-forming) subunit alpha